MSLTDKKVCENMDELAAAMITALDDRIEHLNRTELNYRKIQNWKERLFDVKVEIWDISNEVYHEEHLSNSSPSMMDSTAGGKSIVENLKQVKGLM